MCFISGILLARFCKLSLVRLEMFRDCMRQKLSILEYNLLKLNLFSRGSMIEFMLTLLLDGRMTVMMLVSHPSGK